jgi:hypothetical protein
MLLTTGSNRRRNLNSIAPLTLNFRVTWNCSPPLLPRRDVGGLGYESHDHLNFNFNVSQTHLTSVPLVTHPAPRRAVMVQFYRKTHE